MAISTVFFLLFLVSIIFLFVGVINPSSLKFLTRKVLPRKILSARIFALALLSIVLAFATAPSVPTNQQNSEVDTNKVAERTKVVSYEIIERWPIPNGGEGKSVVVSHDYFNESDMILLGKKLKEDTKYDRNAAIFVYDDKQAALMKDKVLSDKLSAKDSDFYDKHYIGQYFKNGNSDFDQFTIYFDGVLGSNQKVIKY